MKSLKGWGILACLLCATMGNARAAEWFVATNGNDEADGTTWATAKQTIQMGVDAAAEGDTVWVSNGVYETGSRIPSGFTLKNRVVITNDITVRSLEGPATTVIRGEGPRGTNAVRCVYMTAGKLIGFTVTNGHTRTEGEGNGDQNGGGVSIALSASVVVSNCVISGNSAYNAGGAIFGTFYNCLFIGNSAARAGGGGCNATLYNCAIIENTATEFGGGTDQSTMNNCTIVGNSAPNGGGVYNGTLNNCIAYSNFPDNIQFSVCQYTRSDPRPSGIGNIADDPQFLNAQAGNYRLAPDSPCIDAGSNTYVQCETDLDGNPRIVNNTVDMGAFENPSVLAIAPSDIHLSADATSGITIAVTANLPWTATTNVPWLSITSGASGTTNGEVVFDVGWNAWPAARTGTVVVSGGGLSRTGTVIQAARDGMATNWYVATNGNDSAVGTNWGSAKLTIQAAVDAATDGDTVWVDAGTYLGSLNIPKGIRLASVDGPRFTTIRANGGRCITITHGKTVVSGFTITGGRDQDGAGVNMLLTGGLVENSIITDNKSGGPHVSGGGIFGGTARNCLIVNNRLNSQMGRRESAYALGGGAANSRLENCTVVSNNAYATAEWYSWSRGGGWACEFVNSIEVGNTQNHSDPWLDGENSYDHSCTNDPFFVDSNYHLSTNSPCIDAGTNQDWMVVATDLDGSQRIINGTVDIGAYELPDLSIAPIRTNLDHGVSSGRIDVTARVPWAATTNVPWISITSGDSGTTNGTVDFRAEGNGSVFARRGAVLVSKGDVARTCTVIQAGAMAIAPTNTLLTYEATGGIAIAVSSWVPWTAESTAPWLTVSSGSSGSSTGTVVLVAETNVSSIARTGTVLVTASTDGDNPLFATIVQLGNPGWDVGYQDLGDGWRRLSWFGDYDATAEEGSIWHSIHGLLQVSTNATPGSIRFHSQDMGWLWTSSTRYPELYRESDGAWLRYNGSSNPRWFLNLTTDQWESWPSAQADWYVATNGNDAADGTSWATAKATIQAAVDVATIGGRVWVSNGVYATGGEADNRVAIHKPLTVQSVNGPEATIIKGAWDPAYGHGLGDAAVRCVYVGSNAVLSGFTLTNGATSGTGGGAYCEASGVMNHCRLLGNSANGGAGVYGGTLNFCTLSGNRSHGLGGGGGAWHATLNDCMLSENYAYQYGGGAEQSTLNRCRLSHNQVAAGGGGAFACLLNNCLVDDNYSPYVSFPGVAHSTLNNCTVVSNRVMFSTLNNCIVFNADWDGSTLNATYTGDPLFVDGATGNYRLLTNSPCIDAGANSTVQGETDLDGNPRIVNGRVDQGAYEGAHPQPELAIVPANTHLSYKATNGISLAVTANVLWTAATNVPWLVISSGASGITNGTVIFRAEGNALAVSRTGAVVVAGGGLSLTCTVVQAGNTGWDVGFQNLGNGWQRLSWFGDYIPTGEDGWIWHNKHGSLFVSSTSTPENIWFFSLDMGWLWTSSTTYPYLFRASDDATLWYNGNSNPRWFMNFSTGQWESWPGASASEWFVTTHGNDAAAGTSWGTAKRTIQAAVDAATIGSRVWVSNGVYATGGATNYPAGSTLTNRVAIHKAITVQSVNGPEWTIIKGAWDPADGRGLGDAAVRCVYVGSNAVLSGFTLTNGATQLGYADHWGGGARCETSGVLNHCTLVGNSAIWGGGARGGTLNACTLIGNRVDDPFYMSAAGGGAADSVLNDCVLSRNIGAYAHGRGAEGCMLNNCTVVSNSISGSTMNNCIRFASDVEGSTLNNSFSGDPLFVDEAAGDYRLSNRSPCVDAGNNAYVQGVTDLDGNPRVVAGIVDQGAYEFQGMATYRGWASAITNGQTNDTDCAAGDGVPNVLKYAAGSTNPMVSDDLAQLDLNCGLVPMLVFCRNPNAADLQWIVEGADVLSSGVVWRGLATNINGSWGGATNVHESGTGTPVVCTVEDSSPLLTNRFLRLKVTRP